MKRLAVISCLLVLLAGTAIAQEKRKPPRSVFKQDSVRQVGRLGTYCWSWSNDHGGGGGKCADYFRYVWPPVKNAVKGAPARITIKYPDPPDDLSLRWWRRVDDDRQPVGDGTELPYVLAPRTTNDTTVWDLSFDTPDHRGHLYLYGFFAWQSKGDASYHWHLSLH